MRRRRRISSSVSSALFGTFRLDLRHGDLSFTGVCGWASGMNHNSNHTHTHRQGEFNRGVRTECGYYCIALHFIYAQRLQRVLLMPWKIRNAWSISPMPSVAIGQKYSFVLQKKSLYITVLLIDILHCKFTSVFHCHYQLYADLHL